MLTDNDLMPFGKHKGKKLIDVPASYLLWLYEDHPNFKTTDVGIYITDNYEVIRKQAGFKGIPVSPFAKNIHKK